MTLCLDVACTVLLWKVDVAVYFLTNSKRFLASLTKWNRLIFTATCKHLVWHSQLKIGQKSNSNVNHSQNSWTRVWAQGLSIVWQTTLKKITGCCDVEAVKFVWQGGGEKLNAIHLQYHIQFACRAAQLETDTYCHIPCEPLQVRLPLGYFTCGIWVRLKDFVKLLSSSCQLLTAFLLWLKAPSLCNNKIPVPYKVIWVAEWEQITCWDWYQSIKLIGQLRSLD